MSSGDAGGTSVLGARFEGKEDEEKDDDGDDDADDDDEDRNG